MSHTCSLLRADVGRQNAWYLADLIRKMEPNLSMFKAIAYPTALYFPPITLAEPDEAQPPWEKSAMNPKNRIDTLDPTPQPRWRIDGNDVGGVRYFAVPLFAVGKPPLGIHVHVFDLTNQAAAWMRNLNPQDAMFPQGMRIMKRPLLNFIIRVLDHWSQNAHDLEERYFDLPYGSCIGLEIVSPDVRRAQPHMIPLYDVEQQWLPGRHLQDMWQIKDDAWPPTMCHDDLMLLSYISETTCLVRIKGRSSCLFVYKSLSAEVKYMYHELRILLQMPGHPNIISRPEYLVEKLCRFGGKRGVCGFVMEYHSGGTLKNVLQNHGQHIALRSRLRWAQQIISAMIHVRCSPAGFYSDFHLDNFVMSQSEQELKPILVDFEQRGGWYSWSPPEVYLVQYLEHMASSEIHVDAKRKYRQILENNLQGWQPPTSHELYTMNVQGYSTAWLLLSPVEKEAAMAFMLGKLFFCLFEGIGSINSGITVETFTTAENELSFPLFKLTPEPLRRLIRECTAGAPEWEDRYPAVVRRGAKLYPCSWTSKVEPTAQDVHHAAVSRWKEDLDLAEQFVKGRGTVDDSGVAQRIMREALRRPKLEAIRDTISNFWWM